MMLCHIVPASEKDSQAKMKGLRKWDQNHQPAQSRLKSEERQFSTTPCSMVASCEENGPQELFKVTGGTGILPVIPVAWASRPRFFRHFEQFLIVRGKGTELWENGIIGVRCAYCLCVAIICPSNGQFYRHA